MQKCKRMKVEFKKHIFKKREQKYNSDKVIVLANELIAVAFFTFSRFSLITCETDKLKNDEQV